MPLQEQVMTRDSYLLRLNEVSDKLYFIAKVWGSKFVACGPAVLNAR